MTGTSGKLVSECAGMRVDDADDPAKFLNAPLSLQIACQRWEDEKVLAALSVIAAVVCG
jgi:hypothetical protein